MSDEDLAAKLRQLASFLLEQDRGVAARWCVLAAIKLSRPLPSDTPFRSSPSKREYWKLKQQESRKKRKQ